MLCMSTAGRQGPPQRRALHTALGVGKQQASAHSRHIEASAGCSCRAPCQTEAPHAGRQARLQQAGAPDRDELVPGQAAGQGIRVARGRAVGRHHGLEHARAVLEGHHHGRVPARARRRDQRFRCLPGGGASQRRAGAPRHGHKSSPARGGL
jgi:hypothetical protein